MYGHYANRMVAEGERAALKNYRTMRKQFEVFSLGIADVLEEAATQWKNLANYLSVKIPKLAEERKKVSDALRSELKLKPLAS